MRSGGDAVMRGLGEEWMLPKGTPVRDLDGRTVRGGVPRDTTARVLSEGGIDMAVVRTSTLPAQLFVVEVARLIPLTDRVVYEDDAPKASPRPNPSPGTAGSSERPRSIIRGDPLRERDVGPTPDIDVDEALAGVTLRDLAAAGVWWAEYAMLFQRLAILGALGWTAVSLVWILFR